MLECITLLINKMIYKLEKQILKNILILYNPYYQKDVIEQHLSILKDRGSAAFGKLKSKLRDYNNRYKKNEYFKSVFYK